MTGDLNFNLIYTPRNDNSRKELKYFNFVVSKYIIFVLHKIAIISRRRKKCSDCTGPNRVQNSTHIPKNLIKYFFRL